MESKGLITAIQKFSVHDGPGIRTVVFFKGCPLNCPWCSNPETQSVEKEIMYVESKCMLCGRCAASCEAKALSVSEGKIQHDRARCRRCFKCVKACPAGAFRAAGEEMSVSEILEELLRDETFYRKSGGGVTFSGGEPFMQERFLAELAEACKKAGLETALESSMFAEYSSVERVLPHIDIMLCDMKIFDGGRHLEVIGADNSCIKENIRKSAASGTETIIRVPVIPGLNDDEENLMGIGDFALKSGVKNIHLLPYHNYGAGKYRQLDRIYRLDGIPALRKDELRQAKELLEKKGLAVQIGG